jgi:hypothetical protein
VNAPLGYHGADEPCDAVFTPTLQEIVTSVDHEGGMVLSVVPRVRVMAASRVLALARFFAMVSLTESQFAVPIIPRGL